MLVINLYVWQVDFCEIRPTRHKRFGGTVMKKCPRLLPLPQLMD